MTMGDSVGFIGSASWIGAGDYDPGDELYERATTFLATNKWDELATIASTLRNGVNCDFVQGFSVGHFNMVRRIAFADGVSWVARVRMPASKTVPSDRELLDAANILKVEVAGMRFLKEKTSIPVPEVYAYSINLEDGIGAHCILMEYIDGTVAADLQAALDCEADNFGTPEQDFKFRRQMAEIHVALSSFTFTKIGSLYQDELTSEFFIGSDIVTGKGPWKLPKDYYADLADHALRECMSSASDEVLSSSSFSLPILFKHLISIFSGNNSKPGSPFRLANRDFGAHNLLVDHDFNIIGVIDLDGISREPPGHIETRPLAIERIKKTEPRLKDYKSLVEAAEAKLGMDADGVTIASLLLSEVTSVLKGLFCVIGVTRNS